jgi:hypothetical protein
LGARDGPTHAGSFQAIFDQMAAGAFRHAAANRVASLRRFDLAIPWWVASPQSPPPLH